MTLIEKIREQRVLVRQVRVSSILMILALLLSMSSVGMTFYAVGSLNAARAETKIIREDLSDEQEARLAAAEQRVMDLALRDRRIMAQTTANRELLLTLRRLAERRPYLFEGVALPPSMGGGTTSTTGTSTPTTTTTGTSTPTNGSGSPSNPNKPDKPKPKK